MYTLRLLGPPSLTGPTGPVVGRVAQDRKLALLAVLALNEGRTLTRDSLAAFFWPESDEGRARHNVSDGVWVIRSALGDAAILAQGNRLTLNPEVVATDAEAFGGALREGELARAVDFYVGPFMEGFHISGAPAFEDWLGHQRARLAAAHADALETLTREAVAYGGRSEAAAWAGRLAAADPLNTRRALLCIEALAASGDLAAAIRHGESHGRHLEEELGIPPPPEVEGRLAELRRSPPPVPTPRIEALSGGLASPQGEVGAPGPAARGPTSPSPTGRQPGAPLPTPSRPTHPGAPSSGITPRAGWRRPAPGVAMAAVGLLVLAWLAAGMTSGDPPEPVSDRIVVLPFENRTGDPELELLGRMAAEVLVRELSRAGLGEVILPVDRIGLVVGTEDGPRGPQEAHALAGAVLAGISVSGTIDPHPDGPVLAAILTAGPGSRIAAAPDPVPVDKAAPGDALAHLGSRVVGSLAALFGHELPEHPFVVHTPSYESYRMADRAMGLFLERRHSEGASLFRSAYEADPTAVGYLLWSAISLFNLSDRVGAWDILEEIRPRRDELTRFDAAQFDWLEARLLGDQVGALRAARVAHAIHPHSGLGGYQLGLELIRVGAWEEALEAYLRLDPDRGWLSRYPPYWSRLATVYHLLERHEEELAVAEEGFRRHPRAGLLSARVRALAALGRAEELDRALREAGSPAGSAVDAARALHRHGFDSLAVVVAEAGLRALAATPLPPDAPASALTGRRNTEARLLIPAGRLEEARAVLLELLDLAPESMNVLGWTGFVEARLGLGAEARRRISALETLGREPATGGGPPSGGTTVARAAIHAELGDDPGMVRLLLEQSVREGWALEYFHFTPLFDPVRDHPEVRDFFQPRR